MEQLDQSQNDSIDIEENVYQPIVVPCVQVSWNSTISNNYKLFQRAPELDLTLMQPVFSTASSYVLVSFFSRKNRKRGNNYKKIQLFIKKRRKMIKI